MRRARSPEPRWRRYLRFWRRDAAADVDDELQFHFANRVAEFEAAGMSRDDAIGAARARFGDVTAVRADLVRIDSRIERRWRLYQILDALWFDLRYVLRGLRRRPAAAATIIITLAVAVGANGAIFPLLDPLFFRPPTGVVDAGSLRRVFNYRPRVEQGFRTGYTFSYPEYLALRDALGGSANVAIDQSRGDHDVVTDAGTFDMSVDFASADLLPMLGVRLARGRSFSAAEDKVYGPSNVAVISGAFAAQLGGLDSALGRTIRVFDKPYLVIGVTGGGFDGLALGRVSMWLPFSTMPREAAAPGERPWYERGDRYIALVARLANGASEHGAAARASAAYQRFLSLKSLDSGASIILGSLAVGREPESNDRRTLIVSRTSTVALLLLVIACANVANLFVALGVARRRETGVRLALGVSRVRLGALALLEALVVAAMAGAASILLAQWAGGLLRARLMPRVDWASQPVNLRSLAFTGLVSIACAALCGALPAAMAWRATAGATLRGEETRTSSAPIGVRSLLLAVQSALSVVLLVGASLFARTLDAARHTDLGYDRDRLVTTQVYFADRARRAEVPARMPDLAERLARMPAVESVAIAMGGPMNQWSGVSLYRPEADSTHPLEAGAYYLGASPGYFAVTGTRVIEGRPFVPSDAAGSPPVMIVGATMARQLWPGRSALGQCLRPVTPSHPCYTIVGVAADVHEFRIAENTEEWQYYFPIEQMPIRSSTRTLVVRSRAGQADAVAAGLRAMLRETFPGAEVRATTIHEASQPEMQPWIVGMTTFGALGVFALLVAIVGVYGVVSFEVRQRTREIGVRMALGAGGTRIVRLLVGRSASVVAVGIIIGIGASLAAGKSLGALLYGVRPSDPLSLIAASVLLILAAVVAAALPAIKAQHIDPAMVLRDE